jgi:hypothetical protein
MINKFFSNSLREILVQPSNKNRHGVKKYFKAAYSLIYA